MKTEVWRGEAKKKKRGLSYADKEIYRNATVERPKRKFGAKRRLQNGITDGTAWFKTMSIKETKYYCLEYINESSRSVSN